MDYAFAPGPTKFDQQMARLLGDRPTTTLLPATLRTVEGFVDRLESDPAVVAPVDGMLIASHANEAGQLVIRIDAAQAGTVANFEDLEAAVTSGSIVIPPALRTLPDGTPHPGTMVRIRGCRVGRAAPFMGKLKEAFGDAVAVTAPKHFHFVYPNVYRNGYGGMFEWLVYDFGVMSRTPLTRNGVIAALKAQQFDFYDGTKVPDAKWGAWVPRDVKKKKRTWTMALTLGTTVGRNVKSLSVSNAREWRHTYKRVFRYQLELDSEPPTRAAKLARLKENLEAEDHMSNLHESPMWERLGYSDFDDFFANVAWAMTWAKKSRTLICGGYRHEYHVLLPITTRTARRPDNGNLIFNFFPRGGAGAAFFSMRDDDAFLFHTA